MYCEGSGIIIKPRVNILPEDLHLIVAVIMTLKWLLAFPGLSDGGAAYRRATYAFAYAYIAGT